MTRSHYVTEAYKNRNRKHRHNVWEIVVNEYEDITTSRTAFYNF